MAGATTLSRKRVWQEVREICFLASLGFLMTFLVCRSCSDSLSSYLIVSSFSAFMWIVLWKGNSYISGVTSKWIPWLSNPGLRFVVGMALIVSYTLTSLYILRAFYQYKFNLHSGGSFDMYLGAVIVTVIITFFMQGKEFLSHWKEAAVRAERLQKESMQSKYESLKSQVNPHFLFNSLNALTNLVYENQDQAAAFIKQLSQVYRYVLDTREREVVTLQDELDFLKSYLFLQKIRFENNLHVDIQLDNVQTYFPPLVLQMLIENAIKHNVISSGSPLTIKIFTDGEYVVVENSLRKKKLLPDESSGVGLDNIRMRYEFLSSKAVEVRETSDSFIVKLPVIKMDKDEGADN